MLEQFVGYFFPMPHFVDFQHLVPFLDSFHQLDVTPRTENGSLFVGVSTGILVQGIGTGFT